MAQWSVTISQDWDVLGPFSMHAREQYFISPAFPIQLSVPYTHELDKKFLSTYADGAEVAWEKRRAADDGDLVISFPTIRWADIRQSVGWAGLQYHSILRTSLTVTPPRSNTGSRSTTKTPRLLVNLRGGSYFCVLSRSLTDCYVTPEWHTGNVYALARAEPNSLELPGAFNDGNPRTFDLFISGDYEFRLFGDPRERDSEIPILQMNIQVALEEKKNQVIRSASHDVVCDIVDGFAFGDAIGVGLRSVDGWWEVEDVHFPPGAASQFSLVLKEKQIIGPTQTRIVPISVSQTSPMTDDTLTFSLTVCELSSDNSANAVVLPITLTFERLSLLEGSLRRAIRATCFFARTHATLFLVKPPTSLDPKLLQVPILALHGSGVDIVSTSFWEEAIPRRKHSWVILPIGRTEWGLDWHGPSSSEAWAVVLAFHRILQSRELSVKVPLIENISVVVIGHSNGGQGAWYFAAHWPDRVFGAIPAAGFLNAQSYVPRTMSLGARFVDSTLLAVLDAAFTPDNNELFLGNIAGNVPVLSIHGGRDTNVPTWHSRDYVRIIRSWNDGADIMYHEDPGKPHWYSSVFHGSHVQSFLDRVLSPTRHLHAIASSPQDSTCFTLTVIDPASSGSLHGWTIDALCVPGRLARIQIHITEQTHVKTNNVLRFSLRPGAAGHNRPFVIDGVSVSDLEADIDGIKPRRFALSSYGKWESTSGSFAPPPPGRALNILSSRGPITIVVPSANNLAGERARSAAFRLAHAMDLFLKLDARIIRDSDALRFFSDRNVQCASYTAEANIVVQDEHTRNGKADSLRKAELEAGNIIIVGGTENELTRALLQPPQKPRTDFALSADGRQWLFRGKPISRLLGLPCCGIQRSSAHRKNEELSLLFTHPHPWSPDDGAALFLLGTGSTHTHDFGAGDGLERALRLFIPRTGVSIPDWIIAGPSMDYLGVGGVLGAGVWNNEWRWNEPMSWLAC